MKTSPPSPTMLAMLRKIEERNAHSRIPFCVNDEPSRTIAALLSRGLIETWQDGTTKHETRHSVGAFGRDPYTSTRWNIPVIRARITAAGYGALAASR